MCGAFCGYIKTRLHEGFLEGGVAADTQYLLEGLLNLVTRSLKLRFNMQYNKYRIQSNSLQRLFIEQGASELWRRRFGLKITVLPWATFLVFNGYNIVACHFARFAANDVKGRQVAAGNGASCPRQRHVKIWSPCYRRALLNCLSHSNDTCG